MSSLLISASSNPPEIEKLPSYLVELNDTEVDFIHCDVMDGKFVLAYTFDAEYICYKIKNLTSKPLDVHLMVREPWKVIDSYIFANPKYLTVHYEAFKFKFLLKRTLKKIKNSGIFAGLAINPTTDFKKIKKYIKYCNLVLVMSVVPGKSGQKFIDTSFDKVREIKKFLIEKGLKVLVEVDGGVNDNNISMLKTCGCDMVVVGNYLYKNNDRQKAIYDLTKQ